MKSIECRYCPRICAEFYYRRGLKFPSAEGWHDTGPRENAIFVGGCAGVVIVMAGDNKKSAVGRIIISQVR